MDSTCNLASGDGKDGPNIKVDSTYLYIHTIREYLWIPVYTCGGVENMAMSTVSPDWSWSKYQKFQLLGPAPYVSFRADTFFICVSYCMWLLLWTLWCKFFRSFCWYNSETIQIRNAVLHPSSWAHSIVTGEAFVPALPLCAFAILAATCWRLWLLLYTISFNTLLLVALQMDQDSQLDKRLQRMITGIWTSPACNCSQSYLVFIE